MNRGGKTCGCVGPRALSFRWRIECMTKIWIC